jgi:hypothetical protein
VGGAAGDGVDVAEGLVELAGAVAECGFGCSEALVLEADAGDREAGEAEGTPRDGVAQPCLRLGEEAGGEEAGGEGELAAADVAILCQGCEGDAVQRLCKSRDREEDAQPAEPIAHQPQG